MDPWTGVLTVLLVLGLLVILFQVGVLHDRRTSQEVAEAELAMARDRIKELTAAYLERGTQVHTLNQRIENQRKFFDGEHARSTDLAYSLNKRLKAALDLAAHEGALLNRVRELLAAETDAQTARERQEAAAYELMTICGVPKAS